MKIDSEYSVYRKKQIIQEILKYYNENKETKKYFLGMGYTEDKIKKCNIGCLLSLKQKIKVK